MSAIVETDSSFGQPQDQQDDPSFLISRFAGWCGQQTHLIISSPSSVGHIWPLRTLFFSLQKI
uniref:Uncharacterized protein n=1 Tax=Romanomermis culicivorax TaxID=13658 RepID=A0A915IW83_ROMCU